MPIYEYKCQDCGQVSEVLVLRKDEAVSCSSCNSENLEKLMSAHNTLDSGNSFVGGNPGSCCGSPDLCGNPGGCCSSC